MTYSNSTTETRSRRTVLEQRTVRGREYTLSHHSAGYEAAGAGARWTAERWSVLFYANDARHGQNFKSEADARALFEQWTAPMAEPSPEMPVKVFGNQSPEPIWRGPLRDFWQANADAFDGRDVDALSAELAEYGFIHLGGGAAPDFTVCAD